MPLLQAGEKLGKYEVEKRQAAENEDFDKAKAKKAQMDEYRMQLYQELEISDMLESLGVKIVKLSFILAMIHVKFQSKSLFVGQYKYINLSKGEIVKDCWNIYFIPSDTFIVL